MLLRHDGEPELCLSDDSEAVRCEVKRSLAT